MLYLISIHMVPLVPRGPVGKVYGDGPEACKPVVVSDTTRSGKGLTNKSLDRYPYTATPTLHVSRQYER